MMNRKHVATALIVSLFGVVFAGTPEGDMRAALQAFNTGWFEAVKAVFIGVLLGMALRVESVRKYIEIIPFGALLAGVGIGIIGLGTIGLGLVGASITYLRFETIELVRVPLHASVVGLSLCTIYLTSKWRHSEEI